MQPPVCPREASVFRLSLSLKRKTPVYVTRNKLFVEPQAAVLMQQTVRNHLHLSPQKASETQDSTRLPCELYPVSKAMRMYPVTAAGIYNTLHCSLIQTWPKFSTGKKLSNEQRIDTDIEKFNILLRNFQTSYKYPKTSYGCAQKLV